MTKPKALKPLVSGSHVEMLCMAMFRAGVTETSYPAHPGMTGTTLAKMVQITTDQATKSISGMARRGRAVVTTPHKLTFRRYVLSAAQVAQCAAILRGQVPQRPTLSALEEQIVEALSGGRQLTSGEIIPLLRASGRSAGAVYGCLYTMWKQGTLRRSGVSGEYTYSLPTEPAETAEPSTPATIESQIVEALSDGCELTISELVSLPAMRRLNKGSVYTQLRRMLKRGEVQRSGLSGYYVYSLPTEPAEHTETAETAEPSTPATIENQVIEALSGGRQLTGGELASLLAERGFRPGSVPSQISKMWKRAKLQRSGAHGSYVYSLPTQSAEHTEPAETTEPSNSDHTEPSIVQATIDAFHQAGEPLSDEQIEALHHMHPDRHRVLCDRVAAKAKAKARQEREAREARETALFEEYLQAAVEAEQMDLLDT